ncbi:exodeoxyribonuclease VII small subunit [Collinsella stercoris]|uniref:exodeoxyribonuclease VII small subunit n=1 Tax=Collinsella stercoris TaxID=147206 RepID=UPI003A929442
MAEGTFDDITERLDEIIAQVRSKDTSLERSLDLFDEAIELGSRAVDMVDSFELSPREADMLDEQEAAAAAAKSGDVASKSGDAASEVAGAAPEPSAASGSAGAADADVVAAGGA